MHLHVIIFFFISLGTVCQSSFSKLVTNFYYVYIPLDCMCILSWLFLFVYVFGVLCMCRNFCTYVWMCMSVYNDTGRQYWVTDSKNVYHSCLLLWGRTSHWTWSSATLTTDKPQWPTCLCSLQFLGRRLSWDCAQIFCGYWYSNFAPPNCVASTLFSLLYSFIQLFI